MIINIALLHCILRIRCKPHHVNQLSMTKIILIVLNVDASRLMSSMTLLKTFAFVVVVDLASTFPRRLGV
jgi:hypothetical protein